MVFDDRSLMQSASNQIVSYMAQADGPLLFLQPTSLLAQHCSSQWLTVPVASYFRVPLKLNENVSGIFHYSNSQNIVHGLHNYCFLW